MYTFLTILHVFVCIFLMLVVLLQAGRGGGIGLAFGSSGGSQSVFGSSGGATFLTKLTAICAIIFFANSLVLAYMSSQSDSRRLQRIAEKKAQEKKAEEATNAKMLTEIDKKREAQEKAAAQKSEGEPATSETAEEGTSEDKPGAPSGDKAAPALKINMPGQESGKPLKLTPPGVKLNLAEKPGDDKPAKAEKATIGKTPDRAEKAEKAGKQAAKAEEKPAPSDKAEKPATKAGKPAAKAEEKPVPSDKAEGADAPAPAKKASTPKKKAVEDGVDKPAASDKPAAEEKPAPTKKPAKKAAQEKAAEEGATEKPAAE